MCRKKNFMLFCFSFLKGNYIIGRLCWFSFKCNLRLIYPNRKKIIFLLLLFFDQSKKRLIVYYYNNNKVNFDHLVKQIISIFLSLNTLVSFNLLFIYFKIFKQFRIDKYTIIYNIDRYSRSIIQNYWFKQNITDKKLI